MQVLQSVEGEMARANLVKMEFSRAKEQREVELKQLKETLKVNGEANSYIYHSLSVQPH